MKSNTLKFVRRFSLALLAFGWLLAQAGAQPVGTNVIAPAESTNNQTGAAPAVPVDDQAMLAQWRVERAGLAATNAEAADRTISAWLDKLVAGQVPQEIQFEVLAAASKHNSPANQEKLDQYLAAHFDDGGLSAHSVLLYGGNAQRGRKIFFEKPEATCNKCHLVGREGGTNGPPLDGVATNLTRQGILEAIMFPNWKITPGYETYVIKLKDLRGFSGMIKHENETELTMDCPPDGDVTFKKSDIMERRKGSSPMPDGFSSSLSKPELRDLVEYLAEPEKVLPSEPPSAPATPLPKAREPEAVGTSNALNQASKAGPGL